MKRWAFIVIMLYAMAAAGIGMIMSIVTIKRVPFESPEFVTIFLIWVFIMVMCQVGLLVVPVQLVQRRPVTRRHLIWPILVAIFSLVAMAATAGAAIWETYDNSDSSERLWLVYLAIGLGGIWLIWAFLFGFYSGGRDPQTFMGRLVRFLLAGSILELLVAVPTHVVARMRDYCCAGFLTVWGLGLGASVMLMAFGPGVFMLFVRRWQAIKRQQSECDIKIDQGDAHDDCP